MDLLKEYWLFSGTSHPQLSYQIAHCLDVKLGKLDIKTFPDGEIYVQILENVRNRDVFVVQSIAVQPNHYLMELLIIIDALKRASAQSITAVIPYYGYSRQDRKERSRVPITAKLVADLLEKAGVDRVLTMDLHADQVQGFFNIPVDNLLARPILVEACRSLNLKKSIVVAPDTGSLHRARYFAAQLQQELAVIDKRRLNDREVCSMQIIGDVFDKDIILVDDLCSTAGTLVSAARACQEAGAKEIYAFITHGLFCGQAIEKISNSAIKKIFVSNTIPGSEHLNNERFQVLSVAKLFAKAIECINSNHSITSLFNQSGQELMLETDLCLF